jgi:hypothetical protein
MYDREYISLTSGIARMSNPYYLKVVSRWEIIEKETLLKGDGSQLCRCRKYKEINICLFVYFLVFSTCLLLHPDQAGRVVQVHERRGEPGCDENGFKVVEEDRTVGPRKPFFVFAIRFPLLTQGGPVPKDLFLGTITQKHGTHDRFKTPQATVAPEINALWTVIPFFQSGCQSVDFLRRGQHHVDHHIGEKRDDAFTAAASTQPALVAGLIANSSEVSPQKIVDRLPEPEVIVE